MSKVILSFILFLSTQAIGQTTDWIFGVTIHDPWTQTADIVESLEGHCLKPTARIVFDEFVPAADYADVVQQLAPSCSILGEILDSYYVKEYSVAAYLNRTTAYLDEFETVVDIWEIGNEVNGEWLGDSVIQKIEGAFDLVKARGKKAALTLYFNRDCYENPKNEMFGWAEQNIPETMKANLDYVFISYYEDDCEDVKLSETEWQSVFDTLHSRFPNSKIGMGECGTKTVETKAAYMDRYYNMNITTPNFIGGYFWWYYNEDCVPKTTELWSTINDINCAHQTSAIDNSKNPKLLLLYPNPAHNVLRLLKSVKRLQLQNQKGQIVLDLNHPQSEINIERLPAGLYVVLVDGQQVQKILVIQ